MTIRLRPMTGEEYAAWNLQLAEDFAADQVAAGVWPAEGAVERSLAEQERELPQGLDTPGMLVFRAEDEEGPVGALWLGLTHPRGATDTGWIYDIEVLPERRGQGLGRALLAAAEAEIARHGVPYLGLNVFGNNEVARGLYASAGYELVTAQLRKRVR